MIIWVSQYSKHIPTFKNQTLPASIESQTVDRCGGIALGGGDIDYFPYYMMNEEFLFINITTILYCIWTSTPAGT